MAKSFAVIGDTQRTLLVESLVFRRERNLAVQKILIESLVQDKPDLVVHLGDMVAWGGNSFHWNYFDALMQPIRTAQIPVHPVVGNHDYYFPLSRAILHVRERFAQFNERNWYSKTFDTLGLIWLDTNLFHLGRAQWDTQKRWFKDSLAHFESQPSINGILVFGHHPPQTNSKVNHDAKCLQTGFVDEFVRSRKSLAWISGHSHGYEHFYFQGKNFLVSGGGGGPRVKYYQGTKARHADLYKGSEPRPLNYLMVSSETSQIRITARGLQKPGEAIHTFDELIILKKGHSTSSGDLS